MTTSEPGTGDDVTRRDPVAETLARWAELTDGATPGPWRRGDVWQWAKVMPDLFGPDTCAFCHRFGKPDWTGYADINGTTAPAHKHYDYTPYGVDHLVSGPDGLVAGPLGDDDGGIMDPVDTRFVAEARAAMPALIGTLEAVLRLCDSAVKHSVDVGLPREYAMIPVSALRHVVARHLGDDHEATTLPPPTAPHDAE